LFIVGNGLFDNPNISRLQHQGDMLADKPPKNASDASAAKVAAPVSAASGVVVV
jgi:hypothetical protein